MADITACQDQRCPSRTMCYRFTCEKDKYAQSYFGESPRKDGAMKCEMFWDNTTKHGNPDPTDYSVVTPKQKKVSIAKYNKICDRIISKGKPIADTLIELFEECGKYEVCTKKGAKKVKTLAKAQKKGLSSPKGYRK